MAAQVEDCDYKMCGLRPGCRNFPRKETPPHPAEAHGAGEVLLPSYNINVCRTCKSGCKTTTIKETTRKEKKNGDKVKRGTATPYPGRRTSRATLSAVPPCATYKISSLPPLQQKRKIQRIPRTTQMRSSMRTSTSMLGTWIWSTKRSKACAPRTRKKE